METTCVLCESNIMLKIVFHNHKSPNVKIGQQTHLLKEDKNDVV